MTPGAWLALGLFAVLAAGDWVSRAIDSKPLEYFCKPAALAALLLVAVLLDPADGARRAWFVAALALSLAGDVFLMLPADRFVAGLASFLLAHVAYLVGFLLDAPPAVALLVAGAAVVVVVGPVTARILRSLREGAEPGLVAPVVTYILVISAMLTVALAGGAAPAGVGAALFVWSDAMIAWNRFVRAFGWAPVAIMVTYHLGQAGLVLSLPG